MCIDELEDWRKSQENVEICQECGYSIIACKCDDQEEVDHEPLIDKMLRSPKGQVSHD